MFPPLSRGSRQWHSLSPRRVRDNANHHLIPSCHPGDDMARKDITGAAVTLTLGRKSPTNSFAVSFDLRLADSGHFPPYMDQPCDQHSQSPKGFQGSF